MCPSHTHTQLAHQHLTPPPATTDPSGVPEGSRGSSEATTPGQRPPTTPAPRRRCQKAWIDPSSGDDAHRPVPATIVYARGREAPKPSPIRQLASCRAEWFELATVDSADTTSTPLLSPGLREYGPVSFDVPPTCPPHGPRPRPRATNGVGLQTTVPATFVFDSNFVSFYPPAFGHRRQ